MKKEKNRIINNKFVQFVSKNEETFYLLMLLCLATLFYSFFIISVIPPQTGWWQYMAWRITEGELLYKDVFMFLPPYFTYMVAFIYKIVGNHFIYYTILGYIITRVGTWVLMYRILVRKIKPFYVTIGLFAGICITASYLMDQTFDYNPLIIFCVVLQAFLILKLHESNSKKNRLLLCFAEGILSGMLIMLKQSIGLLMPFVVLGCILFSIINRKLEKKYSYILNFIMGLLVCLLPGIVYLLQTNTMNLFWGCITEALQAKISGGNIFITTWKNFFRIEEFLIALLLLLAYLLIVKQRLNNRLSILILSVILFGTIYNKFKWIISYFFEYLRGYPYNTLACVFLVFLMFLLLILVGVLLQRGRAKPHIFKIYWLSVFVIGISSCFLINEDIAEIFYYGISFLDIKRSLLSVALFLSIFFWFYWSYEIYLDRKFKYINIFLSFTIIILFIGVGFTSAVLEELYAIIIIGIPISFVLQKFRKSSIISNLVIGGSLILCIFSLSGKLLMPYEWHSWRTSNLISKNNPLVNVKIEGLEGFKLPESDAKTYEKIVELIESNSKKDDLLYQFPNIMLFNVLTERKTIYTAIPYFDVCPDSMAIESVTELEKNSPKLILWAELSEGRWKAHEDAYRNGNLSGQRVLQEYYEDTVKNQYRKLGEFDNNEGEVICLWKNTSFNGGEPTVDMKLQNNDVISQKVKFKNSEFNQVSLYIKDNIDNRNNEINIRLIENQTQDVVIDKKMNINGKIHEEYVSIDIGKIKIDTNKDYTFSIELSDKLSKGNLILGGSERKTTSSKIYSMINQEKQEFNLAISCE